MLIPVLLRLVVTCVMGAYVHCYYFRPTSVGTIKLQSTDPWDNPLIDPKYLPDFTAS